MTAAGIAAHVPSGGARAEPGGEPAAYYLAEQAELSAAPASAYFLVSFRSGGTLPRAASRSGPAGGPESQGGRYLFGTKIYVGSEPPESYALVAEDVAGNVRLVGPKRWADRPRSGPAESPDRLRLHLEVRKALAAEAEGERRSLDESVARLRADVDTISDIGRIVTIKEELRRKEEALRDAAKDVELLERFLASAGALRSPRNAAAREADLVAQGRELETKVREAAAEAARQKTVDAAERKAAAIELARTVDPAFLDRQLRSARERRQQVEAQLRDTGALPEGAGPGVGTSGGVAE